MFGVSFVQNVVEPIEEGEEIVASACILSKIQLDDGVRV